MRLYDYSNLNIDTDDGSYFAGISYFPTPTEIIGDGTTYSTEITEDEHYRPDKIADRLWDLPDLSWVLDILNDFQEGISEYTRGTTIYYVTLERLRTAGIV